LSNDPTTRFGIRSLTWRLVAWILGCAGLIYLATLLYSYVLSGRIMVRAAEREAESVGEASVNAVEEVLRSVEESTKLLARVLKIVEPSEAELDGLLRSLVSNTPHIYGSTAAFAPRAFLPDRERFSPYRHRSGDQIVAVDLAADAYRYWEQEWYSAAAVSGQPVWSEPYFDAGGGEIWMATYSVPFFQDREGERELRGILTADLSLDWLNELVRSIRVGHTGYGVILSRQGLVVSHPDPGLMLRRRTRAEPSPEVADILREMLAGQRGFAPMTDAWLKRPVRVSYSPVGGAGWSLAILYPEDELMEEVNELFLRLLGLLILGVLLLATVIVLLSRRLTRPLRELAGSAAEMGKGELDVALPVAVSRDEIGALALAFHRMRDSLKTYIRDLQETTAAKQRLESELKVARRIQMAMLPPPTANGPGYELAATLTPARHVGGDLYDHFLAADRAFFMVGDVSGKGVPAALFMARTKTLFETAAARHGDPGMILSEVNQALCAENEAGMFVTVFCGVLDPRSGELACVAGGHDAPILVPAQGAPRQLELEGGPLLGLLEAAEYPVEHMSLRPGDGLLVYTDGVSEALNPEQELFGIPRIVDVLAERQPEGAEAACNVVLEAVKTFAAAADQSDDLTIMAIHHTAPGTRQGG
jgi:sigma-B regulation protein RsbU (phosphoserine phosphatase)